MMLEQRRLEYLQAMGITQWMARKPLAHAPEPRWWPQQAANADTVVEEESRLVQSTEHVVERLATSLSLTSSETLMPSSVDNVSPSVPKALAPSEFSLHFISGEVPVVWVCSVESDIAPLQNFVAALQRTAFSINSYLQPAVTFKWPYLQSSKEDQSDAVALQALKAQWQVLQHDRPRQAVTFGEVSQSWLARADVPSMMHFPSLSSLLSDADHKRALWLALHSLLSS